MEFCANRIRGRGESLGTWWAMGSNPAFCKWPVWMNCHCCTKMCIFERQIIINTATLSCSGRAAISQSWWLNTRGKGTSEGLLEQYFTHLDLLNAAAVAPSESVRQHHFPKNSCYLSDFLIRVDSWLYCTGFGRGAAVPRYGSLKQLILGLPDVTGCRNIRHMFSFFPQIFSLLFKLC